MSTDEFCPKCGTRLDRKSELPCPGCLMRLGMANWGGNSVLPTGNSDPVSSESAADNPTVERPSHGSGEHSSDRVDPEITRIVESQFPGLELIELLGEGGMGMVFKARQTRLDRIVALKVIRSDHQHRDAFESRFSREAKALASLNHPNIVTVHDFGKTDQYFFLVMEYVDGINLRELLDGKKLRPAEALEIIPQICDALQYAHEQGIVHRDIKPENILIDRLGRVKLADYGLAKLVNDDDNSQALTKTHHVMGTPHYMAPEQVESPLSVDHRADIYSLGVVIYEMLTGELPLGRFAPPSKKAHVDSRLDEVVLHSLEKEPARRYQQASEVKTDFQSVITSTPPVDAPEVSDRNRNQTMEPPPTPRLATAHSIHPPVPDRKPDPPAKPPAVDSRRELPAAMQPAASRPGLHGEQKPAKPNSNPYEAEATNPVAEMFSPKTFLTAAYLLFSFPLALIGFVVAILGLAAGIPLTLIWIGIFLLIGTIAVLHGLWNVERKLCYWLLGVEIPYRSHPDPYQSRIQKVLSLLTSRSTWKGLVYTFINFHWSLLCFVLVITLYAVPAVLLAAPVLVSQRWLDLNLLGVEINSFSRAIGAALLGLPLFYVGVKLTRGLGYVSGKLAKIFLSRY